MGEIMSKALRIRDYPYYITDTGDVYSRLEYRSGRIKKLKPSMTKKGRRMDKICDKCGQPMKIIYVKQDSFLTAREVFMCEKCRRLQPA